MTTTARKQIAEAAAANDWTLFESGALHAEYRKGRRYVFVRFSLFETVIGASTKQRQIIGTGKAARVLEALAS